MNAADLIAELKKIPKGRRDSTEVLLDVDGPPLHEVDEVCVQSSGAMDGGPTFQVVIRRGQRA